MKLDLKNFCLFIGHGRSGSSAVGAIIAAHNNAIMSHELHIAREMCVCKMEQKDIFDAIIKLAQEQSKKGRDSASLDGSKYSQQIDGQLKKDTDVINLIGDKHAYSTSYFLKDDTLNKVKEIESRVNLPLKFVCCVRNPYDNLAGVCTTTFKKKDVVHLKDAKNFEDNARVAKTLLDNGYSIHWVHQHSLLDYPVEELKSLFSFLELDVSESQIEKGVNHLKITPKERRFTVNWDNDAREHVRKMTEKFYWFQGYSW